MAWVTEYDMTWHSTTYSGSIYIQRDGGTYQFPLKLQRGSLEIKDTLPSWEDPIIRKSCSFTIINDLPDFYTLMPLMTISNGQFRVIVTLFYPGFGDVTLFEGFLNCEAVLQNMLNTDAIRLTASGLLSKLQWGTPTSISEIGDMSLIDIIADCLAMTGSEYDIHVECPLYEESAVPGSGDTLFNLTAVSTELFWKDNIERESSLDILHMILRSLNCYLYWDRFGWQIRHYETLGNTSRSYVTYAFGGTYDYDNPGVSYGPYNRYSKNVHTPLTMPQVTGSQVLSVNPGLKKLEIEIVQNQFFNHLNGDLTETVIDATNVSWVPIRTWHALNFATSAVGWQGGGITNGIRRIGTYDIVSDDGVLNGLTTHFKCTVLYDTKLTIKFKLHIRNGPNPFPAHFWESPDDMKVVFNWYLQEANGWYFRYVEATDQWLHNEFLTKTPNTLTVRGTDFDKDLELYEGTFTVPIGELRSVVEGSSDEVALIFRMGTELITDEGDGTTYWVDDPADYVIWGDFHAAVDGQPEDNLFEGEVTTDFLDEKNIKMEIADSGWSYRNALKREGVDAGANTGWYDLTSSWTYDGVNFDSLVLKLMESKFRLYRVARQKIKVTYMTSSLIITTDWDPLGLFLDNKQSDKTFIVAQQTRVLDADEVHLELWEYDGDETINLV